MEFRFEQKLGLGLCVSNQRVRDICGRILIAYLKESS